MHGVSLCPSITDPRIVVRAPIVKANKCRPLVLPSRVEALQATLLYVTTNNPTSKHLVKILPPGQPNVHTGLFARIDASFGLPHLMSLPNTKPDDIVTALVEEDRAATLSPGLVLGARRPHGRPVSLN